MIYVKVFKIGQIFNWHEVTSTLHSIKIDNIYFYF